MADRNNNDYESSDSGEEIEKHAQQTANWKKKSKAKKLWKKLTMNNKVCDDQSSTTGDNAVTLNLV